MTYYEKDYDQTQRVLLLHLRPRVPLLRNYAPPSYAQKAKRRLQDRIYQWRCVSSSILSPMKIPLNMTPYQREIYNMMIDNLEKSSKVLFFMPRNMGKQTIKEAVCKTIGHDVAADSWFDGESMNSLYCNRCNKWFIRYKS